MLAKFILEWNFFFSGQKDICPHSHVLGPYGTVLYSFTGIICSIIIGHNTDAEQFTARKSKGLKLSIDIIQWTCLNFNNNTRDPLKSLQVLACREWK